MAALLFGNQFLSLIDTRITKNFVFIVFAMLGVILFKTDTSILKKCKPVLISIALSYALTLLNTKYFYSITFFTGVSMMTFGVMLLTMLLNNYKKEDKEIYFYIFGSICLIQSIWMIIQSFGYEPYVWIARLVHIGQEVGYVGTDGLAVNPIVAGSLGNIMVSSSELVLTLPFLMSTTLVWALPVVVYAIYLSQSATSFAALVFIAISMAWIKLPKIKWCIKLIVPIIVVSLMPIFAGFNLSYFLQDGQRLNVWFEAITWNVDAMSILIGNGYGYFYSFFSVNHIHPTTWVHPHNELVNIYVAFGLIGVVSAVWSMIYIFRTKSNVIYKVSLGVALITASTGFPLYISSTASIILFLIAAMIAENNIIKESRDGICSNKKRHFPYR